MLPEAIAHFRVEKLVGQGGMGTVYRAFDTRLNRRVALKLMRADRGRNDEVRRERMRREAHALSRLNHPNICQVYDLLERPDGNALVVEWVDGVSLEDLIHLHGARPPRDVLRIVQGVAEALADAHRHGVVHRDLKPANIMETRAGGLKVLDFGLARLQDDSTGSRPAGPWREESGAVGDAVSASTGSPLTAAGMVPGTAGYLPPEGARGETPDQKGDVFSLGVTAYELLTGRLPYDGTPADWIGAAAKGELIAIAKRRADLPRESRGLVALIERMLRSEPAERPSAGEVAREAAFLLAAPARRRLRLTAIGVGTLVLGLLVAFVIATQPAVRGLARGRPAAIAVLPIENATGDAKSDTLFRTGLPALLAAGLRASDKLSVVPRGTVTGALQSLALADRPALTSDDWRLVAKLLGTRLLVTGRATRDGRVTHLAYALRDAAGKSIRVGETAITSDTILVQPLAARAAVALLRSIDPLEGTSAKVPDVSEDAVAAFSAGAEAHQKGNLKEALALARRAAFASPLFAPAPNLAGMAAETAGQFELAEDYSAWAIAAARATGDRSEEVRAYQTFADAAGRRGDAALELSRIQEAQRVATGASDPLEAARVRAALARYFYRRGQPGEMEKEARAAVETARRLESSRSEAQWSNLLGLALGDQGKRGAARDAFRRSQELARAVGDVSAEGTALANVANLELADGELAEAERDMKACAELFTRIGNGEGVATSALNLGEVAFLRGDLASAERQFREGLKRGEEMNDASTKEYALYRLAATLLLRDDLGPVEKLCREALASAEKSESATTRCQARLVLADLLERKGDAARALALREETLRDLDKTPGAASADRARTLLALIRSHVTAKPPRLDEARRLLVLAEALGELKTSLLIETGRLRQVEGKPAEAEALLRKALAAVAKEEPRLVGEVSALLARGR